MPTDPETFREVRQRIRDGASLNAPYLLMNALATIVASYGLLADSTAVVIGAMVIAMLLGPITGIALGLVDGDNELLRKALVAEFVGALTVLAISFAIGKLHTDIPAGKEILARTAPNIIDLIIALAGGAAGAYATASPRVSVGLVGVAIATALVPPLATCGILLARGETQLASGAFLLFFTNFLTIQFVSSVVLWILGYHGISKMSRQSPLAAVARNAISGGLLIGLAVFLGLNFTQTVAKQRFEARVREVAAARLAEYSDGQLIEVVFSDDGDVVNMRLTVRAPRAPTYDQIVAMQKAVATDLQRPVALKFVDVPTIALDPLFPPTLTPTPLPNPTQTPIPTATQSPTATMTASPSPTATPMATVTPTATRTPSATPTPTPTPTPAAAVVANTGGSGVLLRDGPAGSVVGALPEAAPIQILYRRETIDTIEWLEIRDALNRTGWVQTRYVSVRP